MTNTKITAESFLDSKELREEVKARTEVLDKVKRLFLIPEMECMTVRQVADYFEVGIEAIQHQYKENKSELDSDGVCIKRPKDIITLSCLSKTGLKTVSKRGFVELMLPDNTVISIPNVGIKCFPKRAILRMGMLLRDSRIAREIRTQL